MTWQMTKAEKRLQEMEDKAANEARRVVDGQVMYVCDCSVCGVDFLHKNPYKKTCGDAETHKKIWKEKMTKQAWDRLRCYGVPDQYEGFGSWDNAVRAVEQ